MCSDFNKKSVVNFIYNFIMSELFLTAVKYKSLYPVFHTKLATLRHYISVYFKFPRNKNDELQISGFIISEFITMQSFLRVSEVCSKTKVGNWEIFKFDYQR